MKTYTKQQIDNGMRKVFTSLKTPSLRKEVLDFDGLLYDTEDGKFQMVVRLSDGSFFGLEKDSNGFDKLCPPYGAIQSIKGM